MLCVWTECAVRFYAWANYNWAFTFLVPGGGDSAQPCRIVLCASLSLPLSTHSAQCLWRQPEVLPSVSNLHPEGQCCSHEEPLTGRNSKKSESHSVVSDSLWPQGHSPPVSSVHGILQARILEWVAFSRGSSHQGSNAGLLHCRWIFYRLSHQGSPKKF